MNSNKLAFGTAWVRFLLAACGIWLVPMLYPAMQDHIWVFVAYAGVALVEQPVHQRASSRVTGPQAAR